MDVGWGVEAYGVGPWGASSEGSVVIDASCSLEGSSSIVSMLMRRRQASLVVERLSPPKLQTPVTVPVNITERVAVVIDPRRRG